MKHTKFYAARDYATFMQPPYQDFFPFHNSFSDATSCKHQFIYPDNINFTTNMSLVGALLFCNDCGGLLERCPASQANIDCDVCGKRNKSEFFLISFLLSIFASIGYHERKSKQSHTISFPNLKASSKKTNPPPTPLQNTSSSNATFSLSQQTSGPPPQPPNQPLQPFPHVYATPAPRSRSCRPKTARLGQ
jgi:hypothetical protein